MRVLEAAIGLVLVALAAAARLPDLGSDIEAVDNAGRTALTRAGLNGHQMVVTILLRWKAQCQTVDAGWYAACVARKAELGL